MPLQATEGGNDAASIISNVLGIGPGAPPSASSPPSTAVSAPTISTGSPAFSSQTPVPGQGIALDVNGKLPQTLLNEMLQLLNPANRKVVFGTGSTTFPGGSNTANNALVTHNLNVVPVFIVVQPGLSGAAAVFVDTRISNATPATTTQFTVEMRAADGTSPAAATTVNFVWLAIG